MNIYMLCSNNESIHSYKYNFHFGHFSYIARNNRIFTDKSTPERYGDIMVISLKDADFNFSDAIHSECKKKQYSSVFFDIEFSPSTEAQKILSEMCMALTVKGMKLFCPAPYANFCRGAIPVADSCVSGGNYEEYLLALIRKHRNFAVSFMQSYTEFVMPITSGTERELSSSEFRNILSIHEPDVFYSPQMMTNYTIYSPCKEDVRYILFDDAQTLSRKFKLAKKLNADAAFFVYDNIRNIINELEL